MKILTGIYKITSPSGKIYIGQSWDIKVRWWQHGKSRHTPHLFASIKKYGKSNHTFEIIHELPEDVKQSILDTYEQLYIDLYKGCKVRLLNIKDAGSIGKSAQSTKIKISNALKGRPAHNKGKPHSEEHKKKIGLAGIGRKPSVRQIQMLIDRNKSRKGLAAWNKGKNMSEEQKRKLSEAHKGKKLKPESIAKRTKSFLERLTPESRKRRSETMKNNNATIRQKKLLLMVNQINLFNAI